MGENNRPLVSIIVPIYMVEEYLPKCIESIQSQTLQNMEIILVDDGSKDGCGEISDRYAAIDNRIRVIHKENGGLVSARKAGIKVASGKYIGFVDGDDWVEMKMFETLYHQITIHDADMVLGGYLEDIYGVLSEKVNKLPQGVYEGEKLRTDIKSKFLCTGEFYSANIQPFIWNKLVRKELAETTILGVDEEIGVGEDVAAVLPMIMLAKKIVVIEDCHYHYCLRTSSMMWSFGREMEERRKLQILHKYLNEVLNIYGEDVLDRRNLYKYSMNNILTRTFSLLTHKDSRTNLWPFANVPSECSYVLYGAGYFGRAVYKYLCKEQLDKIRVWVDQAYASYGKLGLPVDEVAKLNEHKDCDVLVAVLDRNVADKIILNLKKIGFEQTQIHWINISDGDMMRLLHEQGFE